uniref:Uncharacterized protein n=1 Tax=uncultured bacterium PG11 TaxID=147490 RepID=Q9AP90_9BACT|nr:hypothetical protein [uncultured bacterium PG11]
MGRLICVKCCAASDNLNLLTMCVAARAIEGRWKLNGFALRVTTRLNEDARPATCVVRSRRKPWRIG